MSKRVIDIPIHDSTLGFPFATWSPGYAFTVGALMVLSVIYGGEFKRKRKGGAYAFHWPDGTEKPVIQILSALGICDAVVEGAPDV